MPARTTAPGIATSPPTTRTRPRDSLSSSPSGCGSGQSRSIARLTSVACTLFRRDSGIGLRRHRCSRFLEWSDEVEQLEIELSARRCAFVVPVQSYGTVGDFVFLVDLQDLFFSHVLDEIAHAEHDYGMSDEKDALSTVFARYHLDRASKAENHVAPALATRWPRVELAEQPAEFGLIGMIGFDADLGETVENAEFLFAQALVNDESKAVLRQPCILRNDCSCVARPQVG